MLRRSWVGVALVLGGLTAPAAYGQDAVKLEWKFNKGDKFYVEDISTMKQKIELMGKGFEQTLKTTMVTSYTVKDKTTDGAVLQQKIENVNVQSQGGLGGDMDKMMEKLKGAQFTITIGQGGKITKFEGYEEFIKTLTEGMEETAKFVKMLLTEDVLKKSAEEAFGFLPAEPVKMGDTWKRETTVPFGPLGSFKANNEYSIQGKDGENVKIGVKADMRYSPPKAGQGLAGLFTITKGNLKSEGARGELVFDPAKGRLTRYKMSMVFRGSLTMDIMGNMVEVEIAMDQNSNSRVLDMNPATKQ